MPNNDRTKVIYKKTPESAVVVTNTKVDKAIAKSIRESYDELATEYTCRIANELQHKPFDRSQLLKFSEERRGKGLICDLGCGPGHVARFLHDAGSHVFGVDLSPRMIEEARRLNPNIPFREGDMLRLNLGDETLAGVVAFYSIVNLSEDCLDAVFHEVARVLKPDGVLLAAFHIGNGLVELSELWGHPISLRFFFFQASTVRKSIENAGLTLEGSLEREAYAPKIEHQSRRAYILARKSSAAEDRKAFLHSNQINNDVLSDWLRVYKGSQQADVIRYWDSVAPKYLAMFRNELQGKPFDLAVLRSFAEDLGPLARVCDVGCGPCAHVTSLLADFGLDLVGIDISPVCIDLARKEKPSLNLRVMDAADLQFDECALDGLIAYYLLHYLPRRSWSQVITGFARVLRPGGKLLIVMKRGEGEMWIPDPMGGPVDTFWAACASEELETLLRSAGFHVVSVQSRHPLAQEIAVDRIYLQAERGTRLLDHASSS
ncbi:SAM-dependent methyltransferase [Granulicella aggregans]|uniref:SAM-dependent methyltransferase n=1 Tax=Granulicella aggregans TaxID=474949 RepID=A0A7W7ZIA9_9BACT|nr:class I SAM-dependent methyltransferase [Granulicella aggregans]MBB5060398.1 SAM-dependent methyltransferase [Granulicella aggregans]